MLQMVVQLCKMVPLCKMLQWLSRCCILDIVNSKRQMCIGLQHKWCYSRAMNKRGDVKERKRERNTEHTRTAQEHTCNESLQPSAERCDQPTKGLGHVPSQGVRRKLGRVRAQGHRQSAGPSQDSRKNKREHRQSEGKDDVRMRAGGKRQSGQSGQATSGRISMHT
jgi:hypothetical protein